MTHVSLFSGIGGFDLAAEWAGFETILQVEKDPYCRAVLAKHWPDVKRLEDVADVTSESVSESVDVLSGGFPCQPFSVAGKRRGVEDDRYLWPAMLNAVRTIRPRWVVAENVLGTISDGTMFRAFDDLEDSGFEVLPPLVYSAFSVGSPQIRERVFLVAHADCNGLQGLIAISGDAARTDHPSGHFRWLDIKRVVGEIQSGTRDCVPESWIVRANDGVPRGMDRVKSAGNAVVPQQAYPIFKAIAEIKEPAP